MPEQVSTRPERTRFATEDEDQARQVLDQVYGARLEVDASRTTEWQLRLLTVDAGTFAVGDVVLPAALTFDVAEHDDVVVGTATGGRVEFERGKQVDRYLLGDVYIGAHPHGRSTSRPVQARTHTVTLPQALLADVAHGGTTRPAAPWAFTGLGLSTRSGAQWRQVSRYADDLIADAAAAASPLMIASVGRLLAATALSLFPNTLVPQVAAHDRTDAHPGTLRRAIDHIEAHPDADISVGDIARAARVTPRAVQLAFRRHLDTTPLAYLRRVRLERARADLVAAEPPHDTVAGIAARWGFGSPGRFAAYYTATYGEPPSTTLGRVLDG